MGIFFYEEHFDFASLLNSAQYVLEANSFILRTELIYEGLHLPERCSPSKMSSILKIPSKMSSILKINQQEVTKDVTFVS